MAPPLWQGASRGWEGAKELSSHILGTAGGSWAWEEESHGEAGGGLGKALSKTQTPQPDTEELQILCRGMACPE